MAKRKNIQGEMASSRFGGPYARDTYDRGLGGDWTRDEHSKKLEASSKKLRAPRKKPIGKASE
jgi:hypothetical protein